MLNNCVLIGRLTRDPELRYLPGSGTAVAKFTLAVDKQLSRDKKMELEAKNQLTADFINITVWGKQAENCEKYLSKGKQVAVAGRLQTGSYEATDGTKRYTTEVVASQVQFLSVAEKPTGSGDQSFYPVDEPDDSIPF
ncbi:MAG: single-stranded DNA-binding protein [Tissierellia bacterium]|nr:single-stranded DNA-binding protein [Tissierellia bacterium]